MDRFIDRIFAHNPELAAHLFRGPRVGTGQPGPLVVDAQEVQESVSLDPLFGLQEPSGCSPGSRPVFVEFGRLASFEWNPGRPDAHGWSFVDRGARPGVFQRVRASLVVEQNRLIIGPELLVDLDLDEGGRVIGWPGPLRHRWATPSSARRVVGDEHFLGLLYPALVALERLNAEGDSIRLHIHPPKHDAIRSKAGLRPLFPYITPSPRATPSRTSRVTQAGSNRRTR